MTGAGFQHGLSRPDIGPLHHLDADRLRRREVVDALLRLGLAGLLLGAEVEGAGAIVFGDRLVCCAVALLTAFALAFHSGAVVIGFLEAGNERILQRTGLFTHAQVLGRACALGDGRRKGPLLPVGAGVQVAEDGIRDLAGAVDAALLLNGCRRRRGLAKVE